MSTRKCTKTSDSNKLRNSRETPGNNMSTSKMSTSDDRITIKIPKNSKIYQYLDVDKAIINIPLWRRLDLILDKAEENTADQITRIFDEFKARISVYYPDKIDKIEKLRALIIWHILWDEELPESYYENIKRL